MHSVYKATVVIYLLYVSPAEYRLGNLNNSLTKFATMLADTKLHDVSNCSDVGMKWTDELLEATSVKSHTAV